MPLKGGRRLEPFGPGLGRETCWDALYAAVTAGRLATGGGLQGTAEAACAAPPPSLLDATSRLLDGRALPVTAGHAAGAPVCRCRERRLTVLRMEELAPNEELRWLLFACRACYDMWDEGWWACRRVLASSPGARARSSKFREALSHQLVAFAERARRELLATGETVRKRGVGTIFDLTPQEAQIARLARAGLSGAETSTKLFLSPRTIERHRRKVFTKLGTSSRRQLRGAPSGDRPGSPDGLAPDLERPRERPFPAPGSAGAALQAVGTGTGPLGVGGPAHGHCLGSGPRPMVRLNHEESTCECPIVQKAYRPGDGQRQ